MQLKEQTIKPLGLSQTLSTKSLPTDPPVTSTSDSTKVSTTTVGLIINDGLSRLNNSHALSTDINQPSITAGLHTPTNIGINTSANTNSLSVIGVEAVNSSQSPDEQLMELQHLSISSAQKELADGVREIGNSNRGTRVDQYAKEAGMPSGHEWCGFFTNWNYAVAAKDLGGDFDGPSLHSWQKSCYSFLYRSYTDNSSACNANLDKLEKAHTRNGSARQFFVIEGSKGEEIANKLKQSCVIAQDYSELDIRPGDTALWNRGHVGLVESYDKETGILTTVEGNLSGKVRHMTYDLKNPEDRNQFTGFGRPALGDFNLPENDVQNGS